MGSHCGSCRCKITSAVGKGQKSLSESLTIFGAANRAKLEWNFRILLLRNWLYVLPAVIFRPGTKNAHFYMLINVISIIRSKCQHMKDLASGGAERDGIVMRQLG